MNATLELQGISKSFDGFRALDNADFSARAGEIHALLGENGAGKSTLMNICCGLYTADTGSLKLSGTETRFSGPRQAAAAGIGMVHQHFKLVKPFTILENILLAYSKDPTARTSTSFEQASQAIADRIREAAAQLGATIDPHARVDSLSIAEQQRVEVIKALVGGARLLILDEPTAVLTDQEAEKLLITLRALANDGAAIILVTHKLGDVIRFADRVTIMRSGRTVATLDPRASSVEDLTRLTVGETLGVAAPAGGTFGRRRLELLDISARRKDGTVALQDVSLHVRAGEVYGLAGVSGNGQSELAEILMGVREPDSGILQLEDAGETLTAVDPSNVRSMGTAFIPADRYRFSLAGALSVLDNYTIGGVLRGKYGSWFWTRLRRMTADTEQALQTFDVQGVRSVGQKAALLSGGNAQKLVIAREFADPPNVIVAQSPSRGLDARATAAVHARLREAAARGAAVLLISEDLDEILKLSDRVGVMASGRLVGEFEAPVDRQQVGKAMVTHG